MRAVRRQTATSGINPAGSSRSLRLDPLSLPLSFHAHDTRADGGVRRIELHRERVVLHRAVKGMRMAINVRVSDFLGVALRGLDDDAQMLVRRSPPPGRCGATSSRCRCWQKMITTNRPPAVAATTRSAPAVRSFWCAAASAISPTPRPFIRTSARSSLGIEFALADSREATAVVPANAGTHTPRPAKWALGAMAAFQQCRLVVMGPCVRRDDAHQRSAIADGWWARRYASLPTLRDRAHHRVNQ
jgi:hypothetical protein